MQILFLIHKWFIIFLIKWPTYLKGITMISIPFSECRLSARGKKFGKIYGFSCCLYMVLRLGRYYRTFPTENGVCGIYIYLQRHILLFYIMAYAEGLLILYNKFMVLVETIKLIYFTYIHCSMLSKEYGLHSNNHLYRSTKKWLILPITNIFSKGTVSHGMHLSDYIYIYSIYHAQCTSLQ